MGQDFKILFPTTVAVYLYRSPACSAPCQHSCSWSAVRGENLSDIRGSVRDNCFASLHPSLTEKKHFAKKQPQWRYGIKLNQFLTYFSWVRVGHSSQHHNTPSPPKNSRMCCTCSAVQTLCQTSPSGQTLSETRNSKRHSVIIALGTNNSGSKEHQDHAKVCQHYCY